MQTMPGTQGTSCLPEQWQDDQKMDVLFAKFRPRSVNVKSWDSKMKFWSQALHSDLKHRNSVYFNARSISQRFKRSGKLPQCMETVVNELTSTGTLQKMSEMSDNCSQRDEGWMSWGINTFVKKPFSYGVSMLSKRQESPGIMEIDYVSVELLQKKCQEVIDKVHGSITHEKTDYILEYQTLSNMCADIVSDEMTLDLVLTQLGRDNKVKVTQRSPKAKKIIKFAKEEQRCPSPISEAEFGFLKLRNTEHLLCGEIQDLTEDIKRCTLEAKDYLSKDLRTSAKHALRKRKFIEKTRDKREMSLENVQTLLHQIADAESNKLVYEAYKSGVSAIKQKTEKDGLNVDSVENLMISLQETMDTQADISTSLAQGVGDPTIDVQNSDLEAELDDLVRSDSAIEEDTFPDLDLSKDLPQVPTFEPGLSPISSHDGPYRTAVLD